MIPYQNPSIDILGLRVDEPVTTFTDIIVASIGIIAFFKTANQHSNRHTLYYRWFFLLIGFSTLIGGICGHAFAYSLGVNAKLPGWIFAIFAVAFAQFAALNNTRQLIGEWFFYRLSVLCGIEICFALLYAIIFKSFAVVEIHSAFGLVLVVSILESMNYSKTKSVLSKNMILGVAVAVISVLCHILKIAISNWFNHIDLSHVFMALALFLMYRGLSLNQKSKSAIV